jgi:Fe-S-cluster-containing hydrogenase component 2/flavodoxin
MLFYFSGTGNSRHVAQQIAAATSDAATSIASLFRPDDLSQRDTLILVFPVYAWGPPTVVEQFLDLFPKALAKDVARTYVVMTCGDDVGRADRIAEKRLRAKGLELSGIWSVQMPNTYTALPGFDVDPEPLAKEKLTRAAARTAAIIQAIAQRQTNIRDVHPGLLPWTKSHILRPLFRRFLTSPRRFRVSATCTHCHRCQRVCPLSNISWDAATDTPRWNTHCTTCFACYHQCPTRSIDNGRWTRGKHQYAGPEAQV